VRLLRAVRRDFRPTKKKKKKKARRLDPTTTSPRFRVGPSPRYLDGELYSGDAKCGQQREWKGDGDPRFYSPVAVIAGARRARRGYSSLAPHCNGAPSPVVPLALAMMGGNSVLKPKESPRRFDPGGGGVA